MAMAGEYFVGCISGTSLDGLDLALVHFRDNKASVQNSTCVDIPVSLQRSLTALCLPGDNELDRLGETDVELGEFIANSIIEFLKQCDISPNQIKAIGSHGQTVRHRPNARHPFTAQIGNAHVIAEHTKIVTISDFRMADMAAGGQGAPLVPAFHKAIFADRDQRRLIVNLGGISNISIIPAAQDQCQHTSGYDIGPANTLLDRWVETHKGERYDKNGAWASQGTVVPDLFDAMLSDPFFALPAPKSTGREYFNLDWIMKFNPAKYAAEDVQRTLLELTAETTARSIKTESTSKQTQVFVCGGGSHNPLLIERITSLSDQSPIKPTDTLGVPSDDVEACAFAWLARQTTKQLPGNLMTVTGAKSPKILGAIHLP